MSRSSARPDDLAAYHIVTQAMGESLARHRGALTTALDEFRGSTGSILLRDGRTYLRVGTLDRSGSIVYEAPILLTQQQAENLVIRTGGQNDLVELPVNSTLHFTVWTGDGDDMVGSPGSSGAVRTGPGGNDRIFTGDGNDVVFAGDGDDGNEIGRNRAPRAELNSVGNDLDGDGTIDLAPGDDHPALFTENALRDDLGTQAPPLLHLLAE